MEILSALKERFLQHMERHPGLAWEQVERCLLKKPDVLGVLERMEETGGEPDVLGAAEDGKIIYCDCSKETPAGRRSLCYDDEALQKRAKNPPPGSAVHQAEAMGVELMTEKFYRKLQAVGEFDLKTSSWVSTPDDIRQLGGALFCERRYGVVFTFHNGADSYYSVRGWRGVICVDE